jgi:DNA-binding transcriptional LysR family regulator
MARLSNWETQAGPRLRLRDLHVLSKVAEHGSMAGAAAELGIAQPAVSAVIANLERALGVRLFDRGPQGVEPTAYGRALLRRSLAAFDELKQGVRDIAFLSDPASGELRIGCGITLSATLLPKVVERFSQKYPRVVLHVSLVPPPTRDLSGLRNREHDLILGRWAMPAGEDVADVNVDVLFDDPLVVAAGTQTRWASRRKIDLAELVDEPWILTQPQTWNYVGLEGAFRARGLAMPKISVVTSSVHVSAHLLANGTFITAHAKSLAEHCGLKVLPVRLPDRPWPVAILTLKNRTLSPVVALFLEHLREFTRPMRMGRPMPR